jgi:hypothetical protein
MKNSVINVIQYCYNSEMEEVMLNRRTSSDGETKYTSTYTILTEKRWKVASLKAEN